MRHTYLGCVLHGADHVASDGSVIKHSIALLYVSKSDVDPPVLGTVNGVQTELTGDSHLAVCRLLATILYHHLHRVGNINVTSGLGVRESAHGTVVCI